MPDFDSLDPRDLEALYGVSPRKRRRKKAPRWVRWAAAALLAVACVTGVELAACRFFEPAVYEEITAPMRRAGRAAWEGVCRAGSAVAGRAGASAASLSQWAGEVREDLRTWMEAASPKEVEALGEDSILEEPEITPPKDILNPLISDLVERDGLEYLTGGGVDVAYFNQTDEERAGQMYGTDPLRTHGCGPTAMAMAVSTLAGEIVDPEDMARICVEEGYWCKSHGSYLSMVQGVAESYGLRCEAADLESLEEDTVYSRLAAGDVAVALMTKGHFTKGGHFILLRGTTLSGEILVADPASRDRSLIPWDLELILEELSPSRHDGAPLWFLSQPGELETRDQS